MTMYQIRNPAWLKSYQQPYDQFEDIPIGIFDSINDKLQARKSDVPYVSVVVIAWNEERNILNCISSLANMDTEFTYEIIVVDNNSVDRTPEILNKLNVIKHVQVIQGCGPARQMGQENAKGKYVLLADADCIYPSFWLDIMVKNLERPNVVCVYGRYSFIGEKGFPRWKLAIYELLKDIIAELRHLKRPYLNCFGMSMGYDRQLGMKVGFVYHNIRGEDGRMCFDLMRYGKVAQVKSSESRVWTQPRTLKLDGGFSNVLYKRAINELGRFTSFFSALPMHDTKISKNE